MRRMRGAALAVALAWSSAAAAQEALTVEGPDGRTRTYVAAQLQSMGGDTLRVALHHSAAATYAVVPLRRLLANGGLNVDSLKGRQLALVVVAEATDGYRVAVALGEMAPGLGGREVLVAYQRDGRPLPADEGPFRLIVRGDERAARSVRQLVKLRVVDAADAPSMSRQPSQRSRPPATKSSSSSSG